MQLGAAGAPVAAAAGAGQPLGCRSPGRDRRPPRPAPPQSFFLHPPIECAEGDVLACNIEVARRKDNQRLMDVLVRHRIEGRPGSERTSAFHIE